VTSKDKWISPNEASDMVFTDPQGPMDDFSFGLLRRQLRGKPNSVTTFARAKLQPRRPDDTDRIASALWPITAAAWAVVLAPGVSDDLAMPELLFPRYEAELIAWEKVMLISVTLRFPDAASRHDIVDQVRTFATLRLARARGLTSMIVLHMPGEMASANAPHCHIVTLAREHRPYGFGAYAADLIVNEGQTILFEEWIRFQRSWATGTLGEDA
jgi:hypothetical protein